MVALPGSNGWDAVVAENDELAFDAVPGLLGQTLSDELGDDPGAPLRPVPAAAWVRRTGRAGSTGGHRIRSP